MDVGPAFPADAEPLEAVEPGKSPLDDPPVHAQAAAVPGAAACDDWHDAAGPDLVAVDVVVVASVCEHGLRFTPGPAGPSPDRWNGIEQRHELGDVVTVAASEDDRERGAVSVGDQVMLGTGSPSVDRRWARLEPPFNALTWLESTAALDQSSLAAAFNSASSTS